MTLRCFKVLVTCQCPENDWNAALKCLTVTFPKGGGAVTWQSQLLSVCNWRYESCPVSLLALDSAVCSWGESRVDACHDNRTHTVMSLSEADIEAETQCAVKKGRRGDWSFMLYCVSRVAGWKTKSMAKLYSDLLSPIGAFTSLLDV